SGSTGIWIQVLPDGAFTQAGPTEPVVPAFLGGADPGTTTFGAVNPVYEEVPTLSPSAAPSFPEAPAETHTIAEIQAVPADAGSGSNDCYPSPLVGVTVATTGIITSLWDNGLTIQQGGFGVWCFTSADPLSIASVELGDQVRIAGVVAEYFGLTQITVATINVLSKGNFVNPTPVTTGQLGDSCNAVGERFEGVLVALGNVTLLSEPNNFDEITISDGTGETQLDDQLLDTDGVLEDLFGTPLTGVTSVSLTGVVQYAFGSFELNVRNESDVIALTSVADIQAIGDVGASPDCYPSALVGNVVVVIGVITAVWDDGFTMQTDDAGLFCFTDDEHYSLDFVQEGDLARVRGEVLEFFGLTELTNVDEVVVFSSDNDLTPIDLMTGDIGTSCNLGGETYEGRLVRFQNVQIIS
ncbi:MAG: hypothetical protein AAFY46_13920, partial [Planctomycetota bacterium]